MSFTITTFKCLLNHEHKELILNLNLKKGSGLPVTGRHGKKCMSHFLAPVCGVKAAL